MPLKVRQPNGRQEAKDAALKDEIIIFDDTFVEPLNYFEQVIRMPSKAEKFDLLLRMVKHAINRTRSSSSHCCSVSLIPYPMAVVSRRLRRHYRDRPARLTSMRHFVFLLGLQLAELI